MGVLKNARIASAPIEIEGHGILTSSLGFDYGDSVCQSLGGYSLEKKALAIWVRGILDALELDSWSEVPGQYVRVELDSDGWNARVVAVGHITKDRWFNPKKAFESYE